MKKSCFNEITAYFNSEVSGYPFIANIDDSTVLQSMISKMQADSIKKILRVSDYCNGDNLSNVYKFKSDVKALKNGVVLGYTVNDMFLGEKALKQAVSELLQLSVKGHVVIFVYGCSGLLKNAFHADGNRADHRTIILETKAFSLPIITMTASMIFMTFCVKTIMTLNPVRSRTEVLKNNGKNYIVSLKSQALFQM